MTAVSPYLNFNGNTEEAFNFYKSVFGGEFLTLMRFKDNPQGGEMNEADKEGIMHVALPLGGGTVLMGTDALESMTWSVTSSPRWAGRQCMNRASGLACAMRAASTR